MEQATHIRLDEEMGFDTQLQYVTKFHYRIEFGNGLIENEIDHIYVGYYDGTPNPNPMEVSGYKWLTLHDLKKDIEVNPDNYTYWLTHIINHHFDELASASKEIINIR
jgi:isopentenyl-diphosphate delta-isomerase